MKGICMDEIDRGESEKSRLDVSDLMGGGM